MVVCRFAAHKRNRTNQSHTTCVVKFHVSRRRALFHSKLERVHIKTLFQCATGQSLWRFLRPKLITLASNDGEFSPVQRILMSVVSGVEPIATEPCNIMRPCYTFENALFSQYVHSWWLKIYARALLPNIILLQMANKIKCRLPLVAHELLWCFYIIHWDT